MDTQLDRITGWRLAPLAAVMLLPLCDPATQAQGSATGHTEPAQIDRAVTTFTGAAIGQPGGPRQPADRRLRLAACAQPLMVGWHGTARNAVAVECAGPEAWRIFIAIDNSGARTQAQAAAVKRGDALTIVVRGRGFSVQQQGEAMENGAVGEWIFVRTSRKSEPLRARIERPGLAVVPAS